MSKKNDKYKHEKSEKVKIENLKFQSKNKEIIVKSLDFSSTGIYLIKGSNGSGKTSLIENALKENKVKDLKESLEKSISYFPQSDYLYNTDIESYIDVKDKELLNYYLRLFKIEHLRGDITKLSGGEFTKLRLIRTFMKQTPIIILDEPTNNLDNASVEVLEEVLNSLREEKTIILITHDERLRLEYDFIYQIESTQVKEIKEAKVIKENDYQYQDNLDIDKRYFKRIFHSTFNYLLFFILLISVFFIGNNTFAYINNNIVYSDTIKDKDFLQVLNVGDNCSIYYTQKHSNKEISENCNRNDSITIKQLDKISRIKHVKQVYVLSDLFNYEDIYEGKGENYFSIPNKISNNDNSLDEILKVIKGRKPNDDSKEVALSKNNLVKYFNYQGDINDAINSYITIKSEKYRVVGLTNNDVTLLSYTNQNKDGFIDYSDNKQYFDKLLLDYQKNGLPKEFSTLYLVYDSDYGKEVSDEVVELAKGYQLNSIYIADEIAKTRYFEELPMMLLQNTVLFIGVIFLSIFLIRKSLILLEGYLNDYKSLTFEYKRINNSLIKVIIFDYFLALIPSIISLMLIYRLEINYALMVIPFYVLQLIFTFMAIAFYKLRK